jgi:hypothetical protein
MTRQILYPAHELHQQPNARGSRIEAGCTELIGNFVVRIPKLERAQE